MSKSKKPTHFVYRQTSIFANSPYVNGKNRQGIEHVLVFLDGEQADIRRQLIHLVSRDPKFKNTDKELIQKQLDTSLAFWCSWFIDSTDEILRADPLSVINRQPCNSEGIVGQRRAFRDGDNAYIYEREERGWEPLVFLTATDNIIGITAPTVKPDYLPAKLASIVAFDKHGAFSYRNQQELFNLIGPGMQPEQITGGDGKRLLRYTKGKWILDFDGELLEREIQGDAAHRFPSLNQLDWKIWIISLDLARQIHSNVGSDEVWTLFSETDILKRLGKNVQKTGGKTYADVRRSIFKLIAARPGIKYEDEEVIRFAGFPFYTYFDTILHKRTGEMVYRCQINPNCGEATIRHIRRQLQAEAGQAEIQWIGYPLDYVQDSLPSGKAKIRDHLLRLPDDRWTYPIGYPTIAKDWCGMSEKELKRPKQLKKKLEGWFSELKDEGVLTNYDSQIRNLKMMDRHTGKVFWKVRFKRKRPVRPNAERVTEVVDKLLDWHAKPEFKIRMPKDVLEKMLTNTVSTYTPGWTEQLLAEAIEQGYPPNWFWTEIKGAERPIKRPLDTTPEPPPEEPELELGNESETEQVQEKPETPTKPKPEGEAEKIKYVTPGEIKAQLDSLQEEGKLNDSTRAVLEIGLRMSPQQAIIDRTVQELEKDQCEKRDRGRDR